MTIHCSVLKDTQRWGSHFMFFESLQSTFSGRGRATRHHRRELGYSVFGGHTVCSYTIGWDRLTPGHGVEGTVNATMSVPI